MKRIVVILTLICCFSCKEDFKGVPVFTNEVLEPNDSIDFSRDLISIKALNNKQLLFKYFEPNSLDSLYLISNKIALKKFISDFNGDGKDDIVFFVKNIRNNKAGLIFFHSSTNFFVVGAGNKNSALDNISYTEFTIDKSKIAYETLIDSISGDILEPKKIKLGNIALYMKEFEGTSGLLTWDGEKYIYIHTGD